MPRPRDEEFWYGRAMIVFWAIAEAGSVEKASRKLGQHPRWLRTMAYKHAERGEYALTFAIDAGLFMHRQEQVRRLAYGEAYVSTRSLHGAGNAVRRPSLSTRMVGERLRAS